MNYERFSQLWDALITNNPNVPQEKFEMTETMSALIDYANGKKDKVLAIRASLGR